jgi:hypothetical protein
MNIFLCFLAGYMVDKIGPRIALLIFGSVMLIGHFIFYMSTVEKNY